MKTVVSSILAGLLVILSFPAKAVEMTAEELRAFTPGAREVVDQKKVERLSFDRNYTKADPLRVKDWKIYVMKPLAGHEDRFLLAAIFDSGVVPFYVAYPAQSGLAEKMGVPASSLVTCISVERPDNPDKSLLVCVDKFYFGAVVADESPRWGIWHDLKDKDALFSFDSRPAVFARYGQKDPNLVELLIVDENAVATMPRGTAKVETAVIDLKTGKITTSFGSRKDWAIEAVRPFSYA